MGLDANMTEISDAELETLIKISQGLINRINTQNSYYSSWLIHKPKELVINNALDNLKVKRSKNFNKMLRVLTHKFFTPKIQTLENIKEQCKKMAGFKNERHQFIASIVLSQLVSHRIEGKDSVYLIDDAYFIAHAQSFTIATNSTIIKDQATTISVALVDVIK